MGGFSFAYMVQAENKYGPPRAPGSIYPGRDAVPDRLQAARGGDACGFQSGGMRYGLGARGARSGHVSSGVVGLQRSAW